MRSPSSRRNAADPCSARHAATAAAAQPQRVADGVGQFGAIERVEVEFIDAFPRQRFNLADGNRRGDQSARAGVVVQALEALHAATPARWRRSARRSAASAASA